MKKIFRILTLIIGLLFISVISFNCKEYEIRIWGIEMKVFGGNLYKEYNVYTKETGLSFTIDTKFDNLASLYMPSSTSYAFYDRGINVVNPIDTNTIEFYCSAGLIINQDTISPKTNLYTNNICKVHLHIYEDDYGGYLFSFSTDDNFFIDNMKFIYENDSIFTFTFKAKTADYLTLADSVKVKIDWY